MPRTKRPIEPPFAALILLASWPVMIVTYVLLPPASNKIGFPTTGECGILLLPVLFAFFTARLSRSSVLFLVYGSLTSILFFPRFLDNAGLSWRYCSVWFLIAETCAFTVGMGFACRLAATLQHWLMRRGPSDPRYCRQCGYNLTGNVSGRCPECGQEKRE